LYSFINKRRVKRIENFYKGPKMSIFHKCKNITDFKLTTANAVLDRLPAAIKHKGKKKIVLHVFKSDEEYKYNVITHHEDYMLEDEMFENIKPQHVTALADMLEHRGYLVKWRRRY
jgi:predicted house-cleaning noncanonical NTP pyrophosphatase (MazG superfamily)